MANLAYRSSSSAGDQSFSASSISATLPSGEAQNDLDVILFGTSSIAPTAAPTHTTPSGYSLAGTNTFTSAGGVLNSRVSVFYRIAPASPAAVTLNCSANCAIAYARMAYDNPDTAAPYGQAVFTDITSTTTPTAPAITTTKANALVLMFLTQGTAQTATPPSGMTERVDDSSIGFSAFDVIQAAAGSTGSKAATVPSATDGSVVLAEFWSEPAGTTYNQGVAGSITSTGVAVKQTNKRPAGSITAAGAVVRSTARRLAGAITGAGAAVKQTVRRLAGGITGAGAVQASVTFAKSIGGSITAAGALATQLISGAQTFFKTITGSITAAGSVARATILQKTITGSITAAGAVAALLIPFVSGAVNAITMWRRRRRA
jgi:hypothetical protein